MSGCFPVKTDCGLGSEAVLRSRQEVRETVMFQSTWRHCGQLVQISGLCPGVMASVTGPMGNEIVAEVLALLSPTGSTADSIWSSRRACGTLSSVVFGFHRGSFLRGRFIFAKRMGIKCFLRCLGVWIMIPAG